MTVAPLRCSEQERRSNCEGVTLGSLSMQEFCKLHASPVRQTKETPNSFHPAGFAQILVGGGLAPPQEDARNLEKSAAVMHLVKRYYADLRWC